MCLSNIDTNSFTREILEAATEAAPIDVAQGLVDSAKLNSAGCGALKMRMLIAGAKIVQLDAELQHYRMRLRHMEAVFGGINPGAHQ